MKKLFIVVALFVVMTPGAQASETSVETLLEAIQNRLATLQLESAPVVPGAARVAGATSDTVLAPKLTIVIDGTVAETHFTLSNSEAQSLCEATAYDTAHMWKEVECVYTGDLIYSGVFVAG